MATQEESEEETVKRQVLDTPGLKKLIAKVKKGDANLQQAISDVDSKGLVVENGQLRFY